MRPLPPGSERVQRFIHVLGPSFTVLAVFTISFVPGCNGPAKPNNANSNVTSGNRPANNNTSSKALSGEADINIREPDRYSVAMTIGAQEAASDAPAPMATLQFGFARFDADRRWAFTLPAPLGQIAYLEKSGLKYLVFPGSKQYVELTPDAFGFQIGSALSPVSFAQQMQSRLRFERIGPEPVNGRTTIEYRLVAARDASIQTEGVIFVDQETGLPIRSEVSTSKSDGKKWRMIVEEREIQLNPDRSQFDVPGGMKKVTQQEAKQQISSSAEALRAFADVMSGAPPAGAGQPASNKNAVRNR
ncbi:MAG TPA: hypothetical protein VKF81_09725 [Blastocatellia bacterium]|nr:hypothetical protein [Blastocatellia bacterium]